VKVSNGKGIANQTGPVMRSASRGARRSVDRAGAAISGTASRFAVQAVAVILLPLRRDRVSILTDSTFEQCGAWRLSCAQRQRPWSPKMIR
jgi:hypothetical protein